MIQIKQAKRMWMKALAVLVLVGASGCRMLTPAREQYGYDIPPTEPLLLAPGDVLDIAFFGAPELNGNQRIRRDGRISLPILGDVTAGGKSVEELKHVLTEQYTPHLQVREITIVVRSYSPVFVSGAVLSPGRVEMQRPLTALDAIMEAGGFDLDIANLKRVVVIRETAEGRREYRLDLNAVLAGRGGESFYLQPNDIVHVPKRIPWL